MYNLLILSIYINFYLSQDNQISILQMSSGDLECFAQIQKRALDILLYSGRYLFRLGKYNQCIEQTNMDYYMLLMGAKNTDDQSIFFGACLPSSCSNYTIQATMNKIFDSIRFPLEVKQAHNHINQFSYPFSWAFFLTIFILCALLAIVIVSTFFKNVRKNKIIEVFSIQQTNKIFTYKPGSRLNVLNGIRTLAMLWVIFGHEMSLPVGYSLNILSVEKYILSDWKFLIVQGGMYSVDTFFFVGGFLVAYAFIKDQTKSGLKYLFAILNRFLRFLPSYFMAIMLYYAISPHIGSGPFWETQIPLMQNCKQFWKPLLFVDNLVDNGQNMCLGWGWYLQNDMQLFIFSLFVLFIYSKSRFWSYITIFMACAANFAFVMILTEKNNYKWITHLSQTGQMKNYQFDIYYKPWGRCPPYLFGILLGLLYNQFLVYESKKNKKSDEQILAQVDDNQIPIKTSQSQSTPILIKIKQIFQRNQWIRRIVQIFGLAICTFIVFIPRTAQGISHQWPQFVHSIYLTYGKIFFVFGIALLIIPSLILSPQKISKRSLVHFLLDTKAFNFIAKVSFWSYLIHLTLIIVFYGSITTEYYYTFVPSFFLFVCFATISIVSGTLFVYLVEAPFTQIQKILMKKITSKQKKSSNQIEHKINSTLLSENQLNKSLI